MIAGFTTNQTLFVTIPVKDIPYTSGSRVVYRTENKEDYKGLIKQEDTTNLARPRPRKPAEIP